MAFGPSLNSELVSAAGFMLLLVVASAASAAAVGSGNEDNDAGVPANNAGIHQLPAAIDSNPDEPRPSTDEGGEPAEVRRRRRRSEESVPRDPPAIPPYRFTAADVVRRIFGAGGSSASSAFVAKRLVFAPSSFVERAEMQRELVDTMTRDLLAASRGSRGKPADVAQQRETNDADEFDSDDNRANNDGDGLRRTYDMRLDDRTSENGGIPAADPRRSEGMGERRQQPRQHWDYMIRWQQPMSVALKRKPQEYAEDLLPKDVMMRQSRPRIQPLRWG